MDQRGFQSLLMTGNYVSGDNNSSPAENSDESYKNTNQFYQPLGYSNSILSSHSHPYPYISSYDFFTPREPSSQTFKKPKHFNLSPSIMFSHLPGLQSIEQINQINYFNPTPLQQIRPPSPFPPPKKPSTLDQARKRRNTLSDKTRSLQNVLPWEKKMDMATILEETFKYIKFLQAQVTVLESMPIDSATSNSGSNFESENQNLNPKYGNSIVHGELANLNRQQLLEAVVNSPAAQTIMYSKGCCIYSLEQLILFKDIAEKNFSDSSIFS